MIVALTQFYKPPKQIVSIASKAIKPFKSLNKKHY